MLIGKIKMKRGSQFKARIFLQAVYDLCYDMKAGLDTGVFTATGGERNMLISYMEHLDKFIYDSFYSEDI